MQLDNHFILRSVDTDIEISSFMKRVVLAESKFLENDRIHTRDLKIRLGKAYILMYV